MSWTPLIIVLIISIPLLIWAYNSSEQELKNADIRKNDFADFLRKLNLVATQSLNNSSMTAGVVLDETKKEICLWVYNGKYSGKKIKYNDILSIAIIQDNISIIETNRVSQLGGALIGGVLLGGVGAAVGALSGKKQSSTGKVTKLEFQIKINDTSNPIFTIAKLQSETPMNHQDYIAFKKELGHWHAVFEAIIKQADIADQAIVPSPSKEILSISDELKSIFELKELGILSEDEFTLEKKKLLDRS